MPIRLNVGLSKKIGEANYCSRGASINLDLEVDSSLAADPARLQGHIRQVFDLVRSSLDQELRGQVVAAADSTRTALLAPPSTNNGRRHRPATRAQAGALRRAADAAQIELTPFLNERYGVDRPEDLTVAQASQAIDVLKALATTRRCS